MIKRYFFLILLLFIVALPATAKGKALQEVQVADPYIELHIGPARGSFTA